MRIGDVTMASAPVTHAGPTVGFRIEGEHGSIAYLPDHEPSLGVDLTDLDPSWISGYDLVADVDVLFHDAQYGDREYPAHVGWGHSAIEHVVTLAKAARVGHLVLFHHDPYHDDDQLDALADDARHHCDGALEVSMAAEGTTFSLPA